MFAKTSANVNVSGGLAVNKISSQADGAALLQHDDEGQQLSYQRMRVQWKQV